MGAYSRSIVASLLVLGGVGATPLIACGTDGAATGTGSSSSSGGDDGGNIIITPDGGAVAASCFDGKKNNDETDIDCGGTCAKCQDGKSCAVGADCTDGVCKDAGSGLKCQMPTNTDGIKNGTETGIDCGGMGNPKCADNQPCVMGSDCTSAVCKESKCAVPGPKDGVQNGDETDVDCGGSSNNLCADGLKCKIDGDCGSDVCKDLMDGKGLRCQAPSYTDGKKNGAETDVDCGGDTIAAHECDTGKICATGADCKTLGCNYKKVCAAGRSCTNPGGYGADTCGYGGEGPGQYALDKSWEDCCTKATVTATTGATAGTPVNLDKYEVTAGRMRVFLESIGYNVRGFVQSARLAGKIPLIPGNATKTVLEADWDMYLPVSFAGNTNPPPMELADCNQGGATSLTATTCNPSIPLQNGLYTSIKNHLGGEIFKGNNQSLTGCYIGTADIGGGTHAFRFPDGTSEPPGGAPGVVQSIYDEKAMTCIDYLVAQSFCVWDGGRLELGEEHFAAWGGTAYTGAHPYPASTMPWAATDTAVPAEPTQRYLSGKTCAGGNQAAVDAACDPSSPGAYSCVATQCVLKSGDKTYWGCRFPWSTDAVKGACGLAWDAPASIEYASYKYSYEYPKDPDATNTYDYIRFISAPGRTRGRGPAGHADVLANTFEITSNVTGVTSDPQTTTHGWTSNGSWEVHDYTKPQNAIGPTSGLLNKYGKLGMRCAYPSP